MNNSKAESVAGTPGASLPFFTIGHSTRPLDNFVALLKEAGASRVVDVRTIARSRTNPQYNSETLPDSLAPFGIGYEHIAALGGLRGHQRDVPESVNGFWENHSFHNYADYAMSESYSAGFCRLRELGHGERCAIMCAETLWWRCHRRIIADYLIAAGEKVFHILGPGQIKAAEMTSAASPGSHGTLVYPATAPIECSPRNPPS